jgi:UDP-glucose 4-epimerase
MRNNDIVLVTGAGGSLGRVVAQRLVREGYKVRGFGLGEQYYRSTGVFQAMSDTGLFRFEIGSILDRLALTQAMDGARFVVHLAAISGIRKTEDNRLRCFDINVNGTHNVLDACTVNRVERIINISSSAVYGHPDLNPVPETADLTPLNTYGFTKLAAEHLVEAFAQSFPQLGYTTLRLFNAYAGGGSGELAIDAFISRVLRGERPVVFGDGNQKRCFTHAEDVAAAVVQSIRVSIARNRTYNIGNPSEVISIRSLAQLVIDTLSTQALEIDHRPARDVIIEEVAEIWADIRAAQADLKFEPRVSLQDGLRRAAVTRSKDA